MSSAKLHSIRTGSHTLQLTGRCVPIPRSWDHTQRALQARGDPRAEICSIVYVFFVSCESLLQRVRRECGNRDFVRLREWAARLWLEKETAFAWLGGVWLAQREVQTTTSK